MKNFLLAVSMVAIGFGLHAGVTAYEAPRYQVISKAQADSIWRQTHPANVLELPSP
jgi:hypothetical protein